MAKLPAMPFFPADFFADTEHMRPEAAKAYLFLLGHAWIRGARLPNDDGALARMARLSPRAWAGVKAGVLEMWVAGTDGYLRNDRLTREYEFVCEKAQKNRVNGSLGGKSKSQKSQTQTHETSKEKPNEINEAPLANALAPTLTPTLTPKKSESVLKVVASTETPGGVEQADLDAIYFRRGKALLGPKSGSQLAKLRAAVGLGQALQIIDDAQRKDSPSEYVAACLHRKGNGYDQRYRRPSAIQEFARQHLERGYGPVGESPDSALLEHSPAGRG